jgi:hypothetical protein
MFEEFNLALFNQNIFGFNGFNLGLDPNAFTPAVTANDPNIVTRFIRANEVVFVGTSLTPDKVPNYFLDDTLVNQFCQKSNRLQLANANNAGIFVQGEGIVDVTTNAFARVLTTSNNIVYLNQNFLTVNIVPFGANTLAANNYAVDDIVTQVVGGVTTFQGRVQYFDSANGILAITPSNGTMNAAGNVTNSVIFKLNSPVLTNATSFIRGNIFPANGIIRSSTNVTNTAQIVSFTHASGVFTSANGANTLTIIVQGNSNGAVGNTLTITSGAGQNTVRTIVAVTNNTELVLNSSITTLTSNTKYTFGPHVVDEFGRITGIFNIPETEDARFPAGQRVFTITDTEGAQNNFFSMRATATYNAVGAPPVIPPPVFVPPPVPQPRRDPLAQTFFTPNVNIQIAGAPKVDYGIYVSSVDLFFAAKPILADLQLPVTLQIVSVENGIPTEKVIAEKSIECRNVNVSLVPDASNTSTITNFKFDDPVYLEADTQYALVVKSDSPDYYLFISELGGNVLGASPPRRVSIQPYVGSLFKSQNSSTWTPIQNQDLMFRIKKCVFTENSVGTVLFKPLNQLSNVNIDSMLLHTTLLNHKPTLSNFKFKSTNVLGTQDSVYTYVPVNAKYSFGADLLTSTVTSNRRRRIVAGNASTFTAGVELSTIDSDVSPLVNIERISAITYENDINNGGISNADISITSAGNHSNAANISVTISAPTLADGIQANAYVSSLVNSGVSTIIVDNPGSGYITTPTITISEPGAASNATAVIAGETGASGGNMKVRYLTKQITLADGFDAGDLRVYLDANRPRGTNIHVYYKVKSASDPENFENKKWQLMNVVQDNYSADQSQIIELEYRPNLEVNVLSYVEGGVVYPLGGTFKYYAVKIVMTAADPTVAPSIRNFRAIATPSG